MISPTIQFGLETEIGISSDAEGEVDVVSESIALVRSATEPGVWMCWDYDCEDPHVDMRGFRVHELRQDTDEANYYAQDAVRLYKNNTDFCGHSYGCHENYLLPRSLPWETLAQGIQAFLVTRQIFAGSGKFAIETEDKYVSPGFQISQRSDFFCELQSVDTMQRRPIVNTRDEPHANPKRFRRFHVILGDANMSPFTTRLKVGTTALVLEALVLDPRRTYPLLADPLPALTAISRDPKFRWEIALDGGRTSTALAMQRAYLSAVRDVC